MRRRRSSTNGATYGTARRTFLVAFPTTRPTILNGFGREIRRVYNWELKYHSRFQQLREHIDDRPVFDDAQGEVNGEVEIALVATCSPSRQLGFANNGERYVQAGNPTKTRLLARATMSRAALEQFTLTHSTRRRKHVNAETQMSRLSFSSPSPSVGMYWRTASVSSSMTSGRTAGRPRVSFSRIMSTWYGSLWIASPRVYFVCTNCIRLK